MNTLDCSCIMSTHVDIEKIKQQSLVLLYTLDYSNIMSTRVDVEKMEQPSLVFLYTCRHRKAITGNYVLNIDAISQHCHAI